MRLRSSVLLAAVIAAVVSAGCNRNSSNTPNANNEDKGRPVDDDKVDVGNLLFKPADLPQLPRPEGPAADPLVIPNAVAQFDERQQVSAEVEGKIELIATPLEEESVNNQPTGRYVLERNPDGKVKEYYDPAKTYPFIVFHPRDMLLYRDQKDKWHPYRRVSEGDLVRANQIIVVLDDQVIVTRMEAALKSREAAAEMEKAASQGADLTREKLRLTEDAVRKGSAGRGELLQDQITLTRFLENLAQANQSRTKAESDYKEAQVMHRKHRVTSSVAGVIRSISKRPGEFVKSGEKILEIQATETVRLEGSLDVQYAALVKRGMAVTVEPAISLPPLRSHTLHRQAVTGIAVTGDPKRPLVVSVGVDGSALVWDVTTNKAARALPHPVPVRSVACSPPGSAKMLAVTGADDGKVRVWDLSDPDNPQAAREQADTHAAAVGAVAFSPDGRFFATAAGRDVFVWDAGEGKKLYPLPAEHRDAVTGLSFTPQATLVTASRDRTLKVWKLGAEKAAVTKTVEHRSGSVDVLGVSRDGSRVLFDQDKARIDLVSLADKQTVGTVHNPGPTAAFATLALFSPDDTLLVTAGGEGELKGGLQVWTVPPAGGRGAELARLITSGRVGVTAAAFSPSKEHPFLVAGTERGGVHLWTPPGAESRKPYPGRVVNIDATDPRQVTVRVEMSNKELGLLDRSTATIIINPGR